MVDARDLTRERCLNHPGREAAARCPGCRRHFCRECVTDHEARALCAECLHRLADRPGAVRRSWRAALARAAALAAGLLLAWFYFHLLGQALLWIPDDLHPTTRGAAHAPEAP